MSQEKNQSKNEKLNKDTVNDNSVSLAVKKKRFKKIDILVLCICIVTSALIWIYASNLEKKKDAETIKPKRGRKNMRKAS